MLIKQTQAGETDRFAKVTEAQYLAILESDPALETRPCNAEFVSVDGDLGFGLRRASSRIGLPGKVAAGTTQKFTTIAVQIKEDGESTYWKRSDWLTQNHEKPKSNTWTEEELKASVEAYFDMRSKRSSGEKFSKKGYYRDLAARFDRTEKAFEYRMQNISHVLSQMGLSWLPGLRPAKNVGKNVTTQIERIVCQILEIESSGEVEFQADVDKSLGQALKAPPEGNKRVEKRSASVTQHNRSAAVAAWVLNNANGVCECCDLPAPFIKPDGTAYLEVHHLKRLADSGSDTPANAAALCPNCHREFHHGADQNDLLDKMYAKIDRLIVE